VNISLRLQCEGPVIYHM